MYNLRKISKLLKLGKIFLKKVAKIFVRFKKNPYLCTVKRK